MIQKIGIIGTGMVGTALAKAFKNSGFDVYINNRTHATALQLAEEMRITHFQNLETLHQVDMVVIAVKDDAITTVADQLLPFLDKQIVVHTSGTHSIDSLASIPCRGLFYPLDSFGYPRDWQMKDTPIFIDGESEETICQLKIVAYKLTKHVFQIEESRRQELHFSAVLANNFTNRLIQEAFLHLEKHQIPKAALHKLLSTTLYKAIHLNSEMAQTGPAIRGDQKTLKKHLEIISEDPELQAIYMAISKRINPKINLE